MEWADGRYSITKVLPEKDLRIFFTDSHTAFITESLDVLDKNESVDVVFPTGDFHEIYVNQENIYRISGFVCEIDDVFVTKPRHKH